MQNGVIAYLPVYGRGLPVATVDERRASLVAWVGAPFRMNDLMRGLLGERADDLRLQIFDGAGKTRGSAAVRLGRRRRHAGAGHAGGDQPLSHRRPRVDAGDRVDPAFEARFDQSKPLFFASAGAGISMLLATLVWLLASGRSRALAPGRRHDPRAARQPAALAICAGRRRRRRLGLEQPVPAKSCCRGAGRKCWAMPNPN